MSVGAKRRRATLRLPPDRRHALTPEELAADLVPLVRREAQAIAAAGADYIKIDEPCFVIEQGGERKFVRLFNECVEGATAPVCLHLCFGPATSHRTCQPLAPCFEELQCRQVHLEFVNCNMAEVDLWKEHGGKELVAGVVDVKGRSIETSEIIAGRIRAVLAHCPKDKLWLVPDCGFSQTARWVAVEKLKAMVEAAAMVRQELDGS